MVYVKETPECLLFYLFCVILLVGITLGEITYEYSSHYQVRFIQSLDNTCLLGENMLSYRISGSETFMSITGVRGVAVKDINETLKRLDKLAKGTMYQLFDADYIAGPNHIYHAAANAQYALINELNISNNLSIETLLYAACENQINKAIKTLGISEKTRNAVVTVFSETENDPLTIKLAQNLGEIDDSVIAITPGKYDALIDLFDITEDAMKTLEKEPYEALTGLITEKGALIGLRG